MIFLYAERIKGNVVVGGGKERQPGGAIVYNTYTTTARECEVN